MRARRDTDLETRLWTRAHVDEATGCWLWRGATTNSGYGLLRIAGISIRANRLAWSLSRKQEIPPGMCVMHICDRPACINPAHLEIGTHADNMADMSRKGRATRGSKDSAKRGLNKGERNGHARLSEGAVINIRALRDAGFTMQKLATLFRTSIGNIHKVVSGDSWRHIS